MYLHGWATQARYRLYLHRAGLGKILKLACNSIQSPTHEKKYTKMATPVPGEHVLFSKDTY